MFILYLYENYACEFLKEYFENLNELTLISLHKQEKFSNYKVVTKILELFLTMNTFVDQNLEGVGIQEELRMKVHKEDKE